MTLPAVAKYLSHNKTGHRTQVHRSAVDPVSEIYTVLQNQEYRVFSPIFS
jgi:hypothetical protein